MEKKQQRNGWNETPSEKERIKVTENNKGKKKDSDNKQGAREQNVQGGKNANVRQ